MSSINFHIALSDQIERRKEKLEEFLNAIIHPDEYPFFVSDEASVYDISTDDASEIIQLCLSHYGVALQPTDLLIPIWQLLDYLECKRRS